ncbi:MAG: N-acetylmuramoyl-L-alanine amidase [Proteobacteria bacterium]|nr:N-acetylmuramoyl-L-alanine amidase [Pseudomonadota bacterium]
MNPIRRRALFAASLALGAGMVAARSALAAPAVKKKSRLPAHIVPPPKPRLIVLDPGHGGTDPGALGVRGTQEKRVVISVAHLLQQQLQAGGRYRVVLTRSGDSFIPLRERVAKAEAVKADLFLSIHADSHPDPDVRGASVYTISEEASDREAAALAARENRDMFAGMRLGAQPGDGIAKTLVAMAQRGTGNDSRRFADTIVQTFGRSGVRLLPRSHREAGFAVLTSPDIPAALVELGYLSNRYDEKLLTVAQHQQALGRALRASIDAYFGTASATRKA